MFKRNNLAKREYHLDFGNISSIFTNRILSLIIHYRTSKRLIVRDNNGAEISPSNEASPVAQDDDFEFHTFKFESYSQKDLDWILTDIDFSLDGNGYYDHLNPKV